MTRLVRKAALLGACGLFMASIAGAAVPDPAHSQVPAYIDAVGVQATTGANAGLPDGRGAFTVTVRDFLNNPISGSNVEINYANCSDTKLCTAVIAGRTVDCTNKAVRASTNAAGQVTVTVLGASIHPGAVPPAIFAGAGVGCIRVYADGIQLATATSVVYDLQGARNFPTNNGVNGGDVPYLINDVGAINAGAAYKGRTDYDHNGVVNGADISLFVVGNSSIIGRSVAGIGSIAGCWGAGAAQPYCP